MATKRDAAHVTDARPQGIDLLANQQDLALEFLKSVGSLGTSRKVPLNDLASRVRDSNG
jgi:hypothetical protein